MCVRHNGFNDDEYKEALTKLGSEYCAAKDYAEKYGHIDLECKQCMQDMQRNITINNILAVVVLILIIGNITVLVHYLDVMGYINKL